MLCWRAVGRTFVARNLVTSCRSVHSPAHLTRSSHFATSHFATSHLTRSSHFATSHYATSHCATSRCTTNVRYNSSYELAKEHLYDSEGNELPLARFIKLMDERNKDVQYVQSPVVSTHIIAQRLAGILDISVDSNQ